MRISCLRSRVARVTNRGGAIGVFSVVRICTTGKGSVDAFPHVTYRNGSGQVTREDERAERVSGAEPSRSEALNVYAAATTLHIPHSTSMGKPPDPRADEDTFLMR